MKLKNQSTQLAFLIGEHLGEICVKTEQTDIIEFLWRGKPWELTKHQIEEFSLSTDVIAEEYVTMVHTDYGTISAFEDFQSNFKGFLKHLRSL